MTRYLDIDVQQEPFEQGLDVDGRRVLWGFNILATKAAAGAASDAEFIEELVLLLTSIGAFGTVIFAGGKSKIPTGDGPYLSIIQTPGLRGLRIHNQSAPAYLRPGARIVARAVDPQVARSTAWAAYNILAPVRNATVTP